MEAFVVENSEFIGFEYALSTLNHISHCFAVILVCNPVINWNIILGVNRCLNIVSYFGDIIANHYLPALRIRERDLWFT